MTTLLDLTVAAHGGLDRFNQLKTLSVHQHLGGRLWALRSRRIQMRVNFRPCSCFLTRICCQRNSRKAESFDQWLQDASQQEAAALAEALERWLDDGGRSDNEAASHVGGFSPLQFLQPQGG
jgi:hypothetical protein